MLPIHRLDSSSHAGAGFFSYLTKRPSCFIIKKFIVRWLAVACIVLAFIWFGSPRLADSLSLVIKYPTSKPASHIAGPSIPPPRPTKKEQDIWEPRKNEVRDAFKHAWSGYRNIAYPNDELLSVSGGTSNKYNGWGVTLFDSLSTMWVMGLRDEFAEAVNTIRDFQFKATSTNRFAPFFETTIRYLGGTLSAYALSGEPTLLRHADRLGQILLPAFTGTKSGIPAPSVNIETGNFFGRSTTFFSEAATCQLEFKYLAKLTGNKDYYQKAENVMEVLYRANVTDGLFHEQWSLEDGKPLGSHFTVGSSADSGYEYLLKQWVQSGDPKARQQYIQSATSIINKLIYQTPNRGLLYVVDTNNGRVHHHLEHLSCFLPGIFALGASTLPDSELSPKDKEIHRWAAHGLAHTCAISYLDQQTGLGADGIIMSNNGRLWMEAIKEWELRGGKKSGVLPPGMGEPEPEKDASKWDYENANQLSLLRPETIESIFLMWRTTGDVKWRERGYAIFQSIEKHARTKYGYTIIRGVNQPIVEQADEMPSWFLAETLKYLYLLFDDVDSYTLDKWVFNTEAHPLPVFSWTEKEREEFGINVGVGV